MISFALSHLSHIILFHIYGNRHKVVELLAQGHSSGSELLGFRLRLPGSTGHTPNHYMAFQEKAKKSVRKEAVVSHHGDKLVQGNDP